jgi:mRNA interferase MazF
MEVVSGPRLDEVWLVSLDPTLGSEMQKTRPCVVVSPDEMNRHLRTVIVAPMTTTEKRYPTRVPLIFRGKSGEVALDQLRAVDRDRMRKRVGNISPGTARAVSSVLVEMFARK